MREEFIRNFNKTIVGILKYQDNGDIIAMTFPSRKILGMYIKADDNTLEFPSRTVLTKGNTVVSLIFK